MATLTLTEFLLTRIAEDEVAARAAASDSPTPWANDGGTLKDAANTSLAGYCGEETAAHIARHDPARVLAECEAKRQVAEQAWVEYVEANREFGGPPFDFKGLLANGQSPEVVRLLALPYADHPDFDPAWRE